MSASELEKQQFAEESAKTKKVRNKLIQHLSEIDEKITQQALNRSVSEIHRWISRHAVQRIALTSKDISLFDENQHAAKVSQKIASLALQLKEQLDKLPTLDVVQVQEDNLEVSVES